MQQRFPQFSLAWNVMLETIPGVGDQFGLTLASEIGDVARFATPRKLIGYAGLAPRVHQSGERLHTGALSKAGSRTLRWAAVEAAHAAWRPTNPLARASQRSSAASNPSSPPARIRAGPPMSRQAPAAFWPPDGPAWN
jgi:transposase